MILDYYSYQDEVFNCDQCGWQGKGKETKNGETFRAGFEIHCPKCGNEVGGMIMYPTFEETLEKGSPTDKMVATITKSMHERWKESLLKDINELPELNGESMTLVSKEADRENEQYIQVYYKDQLVWEEIRYYEYYDRFIELGKLLKRKYGDKMIDFVPDTSSFDLYGDRMSAPYQIKRFRKSLRPGSDEDYNGDF